MIKPKTPEETKAYKIRNHVCKTYQAIVKKDKETYRKITELLGMFESTEWESYFKNYGKLVCGMEGVKPPQEMFDMCNEALTEKNKLISSLRGAKILKHSPNLNELKENLQTLATPLAVMALHEPDLERMYTH